MAVLNSASCVSQSAKTKQLQTNICSGIQASCEAFLTSTYDAFLRLSIRTPEPKTAHGFRDVSLNNQINSVDLSSKIPKRFLSWYSQFRGNSQALLRASHLEPNLHGTATDKQNMPSKIVGRHLSISSSYVPRPA